MNLLLKRRSLIALQNREDTTDYTLLPLTFKCITGGDLSIKNENGSYDRNFEYSLNGGVWTAFSLPANTASKLIATLSPNDTISFRRDNDNFYQARFISDSSLTFDIYGNLLSLQYGSNFNGQTELRNTAKQAFGFLFQNTNVVDASKLMLTATILSNGCYKNMFNRCTLLVAAPNLPATNLTQECYSNMFRYCSSLKLLPRIYATTLAKDCCNAMFGATAVQSIPDGYLMAQSMQESCYASMFKACASLMSVPSDLLSFTALAVKCYEAMFQDCTSLTTAPNLPATTLAKYCYHGMFHGCISLTSAPELKAATLVEGCYQEMFIKSNNLNYIKCLATDGFSISNCLSDWVTKISSTGTFIKASGVTWPSGVNGIPNDWTVVEE